MIFHKISKSDMECLDQASEKNTRAIFYWKHPCIAGSQFCQVIVIVSESTRHRHQ